MCDGQWHGSYGRGGHDAVVEVVEMCHRVALAVACDERVGLVHVGLCGLAARAAHQVTAPVEPVHEVVGGLRLGGVVGVHAGDEGVVGGGGRLVIEFVEHGVHGACQSVHVVVVGRERAAERLVALEGVPQQVAHVVEVQLVVHIVVAAVVVWQWRAVVPGVPCGEGAPQSGIGHDVLVVAHHGQHGLYAGVFGDMGKEARLVPQVRQVLRHGVIETVGERHGGRAGLHRQVLCGGDVHGVVALMCC